MTAAQNEGKFSIPHLKKSGIFPEKKKIERVFNFFVSKYSIIYEMF